MKRSEMIMKAMEHDVAACTVNKILNNAHEQSIVSKKVCVWKKTAILAAAVVLMTISVSATVLISSFGAVFDVPIDSGNVKILSVDSSNKDVEWEISEIWFDEYNLHIGGTVTVPEVLDADGEYRALCHFRKPGENEYGIMTVYLIPNGTDRTIPFIMSGGSGKNPQRDVEREGVAGDTVVLEMKLELFHDRSLVPDEGQYYLEDYLIYPGEWTVTAEFTTQDNAGISVNDAYTGLNSSDEPVMVENLVLNPFTLRITGTNLMRMNSEVNDDQGNPYVVWIRQSDGTYLGKENGRDSVENNRITYWRGNSNEYIVCFEQPIDITQADAIILAENWEYRHHKDGHMEELWHEVLEIPLK